MFKLATLLGLASAQTTTTTSTIKIGAAIEKLKAPTAIVSDADGSAEFMKFELLQYKTDTTTPYRTYTVETEWDPTYVAAGGESWVYGSYFEFTPEDPCTMAFKFYEWNNETSTTTTTATATTTEWTGTSA